MRQNRKYYIKYLRNLKGGYVSDVYPSEISKRFKGNIPKLFNTRQEAQNELITELEEHMMGKVAHLL